MQMSIDDPLLDDSQWDRHPKSRDV
jgi:hypothetical protein